MGSTYVQYNDPGVEPPVQDEQGKTDQIISYINKMQQGNFSAHRHYFRGTHVKTQAIAKGTLTILPDLPPELAHGIASKENAQSPHDIGIRYANEPSWLQDDRAAAPRGCSMKIFNVAGSSFLDPKGATTHTQDMTFNNAPIIELRDVTTCAEIFAIRSRNFHTPDQIPPALKQRSDTDLQMAIYQLPNHHLLGFTMYSQAAYRWGPYVCKYALFPTGDFQTALSNSTITDSSPPDQHAQWLSEYFQTKAATYDLRVQLCEDLAEQPVEDASVQWDESKYPYRTVGRVVLPAGQDVMGARRRQAWDDGMHLSVWYGLVDHTPLGSVNRLRRELYVASRRVRETGNARETKYVSGIDEIP